MPLAPAHTTFARHPTGSRGILSSSSFEPFSCHGVVCDVNIKDFHGTMSLRAEYCNTTSALQYVFAALNCPIGWSIASFRAEVDNATTTASLEERMTTVDASAYAPTPLYTSDLKHQARSESAVEIVPKEQWSRVVTADVPFGVLSGQHITLHVVFSFELILDGANRYTFNIPKSVWPFEDVDTVTANSLLESTRNDTWGKLFTVPAATRLQRGVVINVKGGGFSGLRAAPHVTINDMDASLLGSQELTVDTKLLTDPKFFTVKIQEVSKSDSSLLPILLESKSFGFTFDPIPEEDHLVVAVSRENNADAADRFAFTSSLCPQFSPQHVAQPNSEIVFVVQCAGGMSASTARMASVTKAVKSVLCGLPESVFVNVVGYGADTNYMYPDGSVGGPFSGTHRDETLAQLSSFLASSSSSADGADEVRTYRALRHVMEEPYITGYARSIILITDAPDHGKALNSLTKTATASDDEDAAGKKLIEVVHANGHSTRVFCIGIGDTPDRAFLRELSAASNGLYAHIAENSDDSAYVNAVVMCSASAATPALTHVSLRFTYPSSTDGEPPVRHAFHSPTAACSEIPPSSVLIPAGSRQIFYAFGHEELQPCNVVASGMIGTERFEFRMNTGELPSATDHGSDAVNTSTNGDALTLSLPHVATSKARVAFLVDQNGRSSMLPEDTKECVRLGMCFCHQTPFIEFRSKTRDSTSPGIKISSAAGQPAIVAPYLKFRDTIHLSAVSSGKVVRDVNGLAATPGKRQTGAKPGNSMMNATAATKSENSIFIGDIVAESIVSTVCNPFSPEEVLRFQTSIGLFPLDESVRLWIGGAREYAMGDGCASLPNIDELHKLTPEGEDAAVWATSLILIAMEKLVEKNNSLGALFSLSEAKAIAATNAHSRKYPEVREAAQSIF